MSWEVDQDNNGVTIKLFDDDGKLSMEHCCRTTREQAEAEQLRAGIEKILEELEGDDADHYHINSDRYVNAEGIASKLQRLIDDTDAEDSVQFLMRMQKLHTLATSGWESTKVLAVAYNAPASEEAAIKALDRLKSNELKVT